MPGCRRSGASGVAPVLLLDEIAAHLDATRRAALFEEILALNAQAWMTGTDKACLRRCCRTRSASRSRAGSFVRQD